MLQLFMTSNDGHNHSLVKNSFGSITRETTYKQRPEITAVKLECHFKPSLCNRPD